MSSTCKTRPFDQNSCYHYFQAKKILLQLCSPALLSSELFLEQWISVHSCQAGPGLGGRGRVGSARNLGSLELTWSSLQRQPVVTNIHLKLILNFQFNISICNQVIIFWWVDLLF